MGLFDRIGRELSRGVSAVASGLASAGQDIFGQVVEQLPGAILGGIEQRIGGMEPVFAGPGRVTTGPIFPSTTPGTPAFRARGADLPPGPSSVAEFFGDQGIIEDPEAREAREQQFLAGLPVPVPVGGTLPVFPGAEEVIFGLGERLAREGLKKLGEILEPEDLLEAGRTALTPFFGPPSPEEEDVSLQTLPFGGRLFRRTDAGIRPKSMIMIPHPISGKPVIFKHAGRVLLTSSDLAAARKVDRLARRAKRTRRGR